MSRGEALWYLQGIDLALADAGKRLLAARAQVGETPALQEARQSVSDGEERLRQLRTEVRSAELELSSLDAKITEVGGRLYGGRVTNPKELASLQQDLHLLKHKQGELEDGVLQTMTEIEEQEVALASQRQTLQAVEADWNASQKTLAAAIGELEAQFRALSAQRTAALNGVSAEDFGAYDEIRRRKGGQAVARLQGDHCESCHVEVPPAKKQRVRAQAELVLCDACGRILYAV